MSRRKHMTYEQLPVEQQAQLIEHMMSEFAMSRDEAIADLIACSGTEDFDLHFEACVEGYI